MNAASRVLSFAGWAFLPGLATSLLQSLYYRLTIRAGSPQPQPGSTVYTRHHRRIHVAVISSYLLYVLYEELHALSTAGDFYSALGVLPTTDERTIKTRFRRLAAQVHPDKTGAGEGADALFVALRLAQDTLLDPARRFAYDRFGAGVVEGKTLGTGGYFWEGLFALAPQYAGGFVMMVVLNMFWLSAWARYWRFYTFFALLTLELTLLTHRNATLMPSLFLPAAVSRLLGLERLYLLPFQTLALARTAAVTANIFISQLTPAEAQARGKKDTGLSGQTQRQLGRVVQLAQAAAGETGRLLALEVRPFRGDGAGVARLRDEMKGRLARGEPEVRAAVDQVVKSSLGGSSAVSVGQSSEGAV